MQCARCGTPVDGRFCPACGAPAPVAPNAAPTFGGVWPCPRCGTVYAGNFCPRCGLPVALAYVVPYRSTAGRSVLSVLWTIALAAFLILLATDFAGLLIAPGLVAAMAPGISQGATTNPDLDIDRTGWTFQALGATATDAYRNPTGDGYLEMSSTTFAGTNPIGFWWQAFDVSGSRPFIAAVTLDVRVVLGDNATSGVLSVFVTDTAQLPAATEAVGSVAYPMDSDWTATPRFLADSQIDGPGRFYLLVAFSTTGAGLGTSTFVSVDDVRLRWTTDAGVILYLALPEPTRIFQTQDPNVFLAYYGFLVALIVGASVYHAVRDRKAIAAAFTAPLEAVGRRLRSGCAWLAVAQVWLAFSFFQFVVILVLASIGQLPAPPFQPTAENAWVYLYGLANASVYEEFAFRVVPLGLPLAVGSLISRVLELTRRGGAWRGRTTPSRHLVGSLRFLLGGNVRSMSSRETLLASWAFLFGSAFLFGLAHVPGWGLWKFFPAFVAGLGFGYLFLRYGVTAAILAHFANNYVSSLTYMGIGGMGLEAFLSLLYLGLVAAGSGFFVWYVLYAWKHLRSLWRRFFGGPTAPSAVSPPIGAPVPASPPYLASPHGSWPGASAPASLPPMDPARPAAEYVPTYRPPPYGYPPVRFQCPSCGWIEARYEGGRFTCVRCGRTA